MLALAVMLLKERKAEGNKEDSPYAEQVQQDPQKAKEAMAVGTALDNHC